MVEALVVDNNDGSFSVSYTPAEAGSYSVWVCVKAQHVKVLRFPVIHILTPATSVRPRHRAARLPLALLRLEPSGITAISNSVTR